MRKNLIASAASETLSTHAHCRRRVRLVYPSIFSLNGDTTGILVNVASPPLLLTRVCCLWRVLASLHIQCQGSGRRILRMSARSGSPLTLRIAQKCRDRSKSDHSIIDFQLFSSRRCWENGGYVTHILWVLESQLRHTTLENIGVFLDRLPQT